MKYWSCYIPTDCVFEIKVAVLERVQELGKLIFESSKPGHENESQFWEKYVALRDVYLCLEGADKNEEFVSLTTFKPKDDSNIIMHREAKFDFPLKDDEED